MTKAEIMTHLLASHGGAMASSEQDAQRLVNKAYKIAKMIQHKALMGNNND